MKCLDHLEWRSVRYRARIWWCGDDDCDCQQPMIERVSPNKDAGYPWVIPVTVWEGTFFSQPASNDYDVMEREIQEAALRYGIPLDSYRIGAIMVSAEEDYRLQESYACKERPDTA